MTNFNKDNNNNIKVVPSLTDALKYSESKEYDVAWVAGGSRIYDETLATYKVSDIHLTRVDTEAVCDTFFPHFEDLFDINNVGGWYIENDIRYRYEYYRSKMLSTQIYNEACG